jgi:predicted Zn-dependent protease
MQVLIDRAVTYLPKDSFYSIMEQYKMQTDSIPASVYKTYLSVNPDDKFAASRLANVLFDQKQYNEADALLDDILAKEPLYYGALVLKTSLKREEVQFDSSYYFINRLLSLNYQDVFALASKVRTLLKQKKDGDALALAKSAVALNGKDAYALGSLALAYHYNGDGKARDAVLEKVEKDIATASMIAYIKNVINGKENFRN